MPATLPGLGLVGDWTSGEDGWGSDMNFALLALSSLIGKALDSITAPLPGTVSNGTITVDPSVGPTQGFIAIGHNDAWSFVAPEFGWTFYVRDEARFATYTVSGWVWTPLEAVVPFGAGDAGKVLAVNSSEDGTEWVAPAVDELPAIGTGDAGKVLAVNVTEDGTEWVAASSGGGDELPAIGTGDAGKVLAVNVTEDGVEWVAPAADELPAIGTGDAGKVLAVNVTEDGTEWVAPSGGGGLPTSPSMDPEKYLLGLDSSGDAQWLNRYSLNGLYVSGSITSGVTLTAGHINTLLWMNTATGDLTVTVPKNTTEALPVGFTALILNGGGNRVLVAPEDGSVTIYCAAVAASRAQYSIMSVTKIAANVWVLTGDLESV